MPEQHLLQHQLISLIPVLIGGLLAICGAAVAQQLTYRLTTKRERANLRRERLEAFVQALMAHDEWVQEKLSMILFRGQEHEVPNPLTQARTIEVLHFPELSEHVISIMKAQAPLINFIGSQHLEKMKDLNQWLKTWNPKPFYDAYAAYKKELNKTLLKSRQLFKEP